MCRIVTTRIINIIVYVNRDRYLFKDIIEVTDFTISKALISRHVGAIKKAKNASSGNE